MNKNIRDVCFEDVFLWVLIRNCDLKIIRYDRKDPGILMWDEFVDVLMLMLSKIVVKLLTKCREKIKM